MAVICKLKKPDDMNEKHPVEMKGDIVMNGLRQIRAAYVRGGTSRALLFRKQDLPRDQDEWGAIFASALGSPDQSGRQLDGLGGGISSLSKVAVVSPSHHDGCDVDYHFFQVEPQSGRVQTLANCGNISSAVGPFALANGWARSGSPTSVAIYNVNSGKRIVSTFASFPSEEDFIAIDGVPGKAPAISLSFVEPGGSVVGSLFPTGRRRDVIDTYEYGPLALTLIDATVPTVIVEASSLGLSGDEAPNVLAARIDLEPLRIECGLRMQLTRNRAELQTDLANIPDIVMISPARESGIQARFYSSGGMHRAAPVTSSIALACACHIDGTVAHGLVAEQQRPDDGWWRIHHPAGEMAVHVAGDGATADIDAATVFRTSRLLMEGNIILPVNF
ncbi:PrpF domain-containing protein [Paraburkholderia xenovorans]|uniref:PrpF domain-containing protein n=1 Tax=Paraburkholderia xenovorans TaxID=36873 RepID=UPI0038BA5E0F